MLALFLPQGLCTHHDLGLECFSLLAIIPHLGSNIPATELKIPNPGHMCLFPLCNLLPKAQTHFLTFCLSSALVRAWEMASWQK